ncbi:hypothetical protein FOA43_000284 [Brettanomyces nanus]|uniref:RING-type domain-containing protein n=1 Tax=Eeniella nana TaxID=13502 RepID=A0A875RMZ4_EENNA|nr:uncharacterized protein FOA43_000284 [Brettanomyces nanus]QPG72980.1 hypothetical protein FOA43_000284 [Brettanomyces nanus]
MSATDHSITQQERLASRGIIEMPSGRLRLPPVIIQYADGTTQNLFLEVGHQNGELAAYSTTLLTDFLLSRGQRASMNGFPGVNGANGVNGASQTGATSSGTASGSSFTSVAPIPITATTPVHSNPTSTSHPRGIRGIDYPAFDVSREGIYGEERRNRSDFMNEIMGPIQRALESADSANTANNATATGNDDHSETSRNIILTVNYIYGQSPNAAPITTTNNGNAANNSDGITGSLILHVPSINENDEENLQVLVRLATIIALRTISSSIKKASGVPDQVFEDFKLPQLSCIEKSDRQCPICYEEYQSSQEEDKLNDNGKRPMLTENSPSKKRQKTVTGVKHTKSTGTEPDAESKEKRQKYSHVPVEMPCGHLFGRTCLYEWLKTNNSCPLCRDKIRHTKGSESGYATTVVLPNLAQVVSDSREVIDGFNSRHLAFLLPDSNGNISEPNGSPDQETALPVTLPFRFPTIVALHPEANGRGISAVAGTAGALGATGGVSITDPAVRPNQSVMGIVRNLIQNINERLHHPIRLSNDAGTTAAISNGFLDHMPIVRTIRRNPRTFQARRSSSQLRRRLDRSRAAAQSTSAAHESLFPMGVMSRRVEHGVITSSINSRSAEENDEQESENGPQQDTLNQDDTQSAEPHSHSHTD